MGPRRESAKGKELPGYDGVVLYDRKRDGAYGMARYMVEGAERSIFLHFRERHIQELVALNYAEILRRDVRLVIV